MKIALFRAQLKYITRTSLMEYASDRSDKIAGHDILDIFKMLSDWDVG